MKLSQPRFLLDSGLERLNRNLRLLGFDSIQTDDFSLENFRREFANEGRQLLTLSSETARDAGPEVSFLVPDADQGAQLLSVLRQYELIDQVRAKQGFLSRCLECNSPLLPVKPHHVHHLLPGTLLLEHDDFLLCPRCERVFWMNQSMKQMKEWIQGLVNGS